MLKSKKTNQNEVFSDGIITPLKVIDGVIISEKSESILRYGDRTVGVNRFYQAKVTGNTIERLISIPFNDIVERNDVIELTEYRTGNKILYEIVQLQQKFDTAPPSMLLTLRKDEINYVDQRIKKSS